MIGLLMSGGLDSSSLAYMLRPDIAFNINYGQKPAIAERQATDAICKELNIRVINLDIDCTSLGSGDLSDNNAIDVAPESDWWPYRNQLLITLAAMKAVSLGCTKLLIGTVASDEYHLDGTGTFVKKINDLISYQEGNIQIEAPAIGLTATELIKESGIPFGLLAYSHSCHKSNIPCVNCRGCNKHYDTLRQLGIYNDELG